MSSGCNCADTEPGSEKWLEINKQYSEIWPNINEKKIRLRTEKFKDEQNKFEKYFKENLKKKTKSKKTKKTVKTKDIKKIKKSSKITKKYPKK